MNTIRSTWIGWGTLIIAGGGAYYFAKRSINADRTERHQASIQRRQREDALEEKAHTQVSSQNGRQGRLEYLSSPSQEAGHDPAPTRHAPEHEGHQVKKKSKYEATEPYRPRKGNRLS